MTSTADVKNYLFMKNLFFALFAVLAIGFTSCGGDDCSLESVAADAEAYLELGTTYINDDTKENCDAYKAALVSFVAEYEGCDEASIAGQVTATQSVIDGLDCQ